MNFLKKPYVLVCVGIVILASIFYFVFDNDNSEISSESTDTLVKSPQQAHKIFGYSFDSDYWNTTIGEYNAIDDKQGQYRLIFSNKNDNSTVEMFYVSSLKSLASNPTGLDPNQHEQLFTTSKAEEIGEVNSTHVGIIPLQNTPYLGSYEYNVVDMNTEVVVEGGYMYELETRLFAKDLLALEDYNQSMIITLKLRSLDDVIRDKQKTVMISLLTSLKKSEPEYGLTYINDTFQTPFGSTEDIHINQGFSESHQALDIVPSLEYYKSDTLYTNTGLEVMYALCTGTAHPSTDQSGAKIIKLQCSNSDIVFEYWHNEINFVYENQAVEEGQVIGIMGETGNAHGRHLHLVVLENGMRINPEKFIN